MQIPQGPGGITSIGMMKVRSNEALARETEQRATVNQRPVVVDALAGYLETCWANAKQAKLPIEQQMLRNLRQRHGVYEPEKLAVIRAMGGSEVYMLLTSTKCRAAEAWIEDILKPVAERPWELRPTPIADLPPDIVDVITQEVLAVQNEILQQAAQAQQILPSALLAQEIRQYTEQRRDEVIEELQEEANRRAERMSEKIADQLAEGGWHDAFWSVVSDFVTLKAGILKGPVLRVRRKKTWGRQGNRWVPTIKLAMVPEFERVSPFDLYPEPGISHPDDGYVFERHRLTAGDLESFMGVPGFNVEAIRQALADYRGGGLREDLYPDAERRLLEFGQTDTANLKWIEALEFWGSVPGKWLMEHGVTAPDMDPDREYEVNVWKIGRHIIRAVLNPDKQGRKPYSVGGYEKVPGSFWWKGVPELMGDLQDVCNSVGRALANNSMLASGPLVEVDVDRVGDKTTFLHPWKIYESSNRQMSEQPAVRFYQPQIIVQPLLQAFDFFMTMAEDQTNIPRWSHGNSNMGGAGGTSSGLSMLMTAATRGMKKVISHIDNMTAGAIERLYDYNMAYDPDDTIKGDCRVMARGTSALVEKEQRIVRRNEFLATTGNPIDVQLVGPKNRLRMLIQQANDLGLEVDRPDDNELQEILQQVAMQIAATQAPKGAQPVGAPAQPKGSLPPPAAPQTLDDAGRPAGGQEEALAQTPEGVTPGVA